MNGFKYAANLDVIIDEATGHHITRQATERLLKVWGRLHDEHLRSGSIIDRMTARAIDDARRDLAAAAPAAWVAAEPIAALEPISLRVRALNPEPWPKGGVA